MEYERPVIEDREPVDALLGAALSDSPPVCCI